MKEPLSTESYKGVRDFYPSDWKRLEGMFKRVRETLLSWGYEEYNASPLERAELYEAKTSEEIVDEQTYTFIDRGDRRVTLRPEMTPTLARMVAGKRGELSFPLRWFSIGNRFRYERPQKGRLREFYQVDVDIVGLSEGEADNEVIMLGAAILKAFGARENDFVIRASSRALLNAACKAAGLSKDELRRYLRLLDKKAKMAPEAFQAAASSLATEDPIALLERPDSSGKIMPLKRELLDRIESLKARGVSNIVFDPSITRGFDYYTGLIFEFFDTNPANPRSLFGGGRYDGLVALWGGNPIPAVGFALGDVTLSDFLETRGLAPSTSGNGPQLYLGTPRGSDIAATQAIAATLREQGCRVFVNISGRSLADQVRDALKRGIPFFAAYGPEEVRRGSILLKMLATGEEVESPIRELPSRLRSEL